MEAYELFQAAQALQYKEQKINDALNAYQLIIDTYPNSVEAGKAKKEMDMIENNRTKDHFGFPSTKVIPSTQKGFNPDYLSGFGKFLLILGAVLILAGIVLAVLVPNSANGDPLSSSIIRSVQNNLKVIYISGGLVLGALCFIFASILYHLTCFKAIIIRCIALEKKVTEIPTDVPNESFLRRYYHD